MNTLKDTNPENLLFIDIETVPQHESYSQLTPIQQELWERRFSADAYHTAGIYAEFGKIICISAGVINTRKDDGNTYFISKSFASDDERQLLSDFGQTINNFFSSRSKTFCGHNIKEFDIPYIARRMLINGLPLPECLQVAGKKPWETQFIDTMELWRFGDYKNYTPLCLLTEVLGLPTPKDDIDGSMVRDVYYNEHDLQRISTYCEKDVLATAQVLLRFMGRLPIDAENVIHKD